MSENTLDTAELSQGTEHSTKTAAKTVNDIVWTWIQPTFALGAPLLVAVTLLSDWWQEADRMLFDHDLYSDPTFRLGGKTLGQG